MQSIPPPSMFLVVCACSCHGAERHVNYPRTRVPVPGCSNDLKSRAEGNTVQYPVQIHPTGVINPTGPCMYLVPPLFLFFWPHLSPRFSPSPLLSVRAMFGQGPHSVVFDGRISRDTDSFSSPPLFPPSALPELSYLGAFFLKIFFEFY